MKFVTDFIFKLDKLQVINSLSTYDQLVDKSELSRLYNSLLPVLYDTVHPSGIFNVEKSAFFPAMGRYEYAVPCIITLGKSIGRKIDEYFSLRKLPQGIMLNAMSNSYLFDISSQLFEKIYIEASKLNLGLSPRLSPGSCELPMEYQKSILEILNNSRILDMTITENYMLNPIHSMTYIYGADKKISSNKIDHNCSKCQNRKSCIMRKDSI